MEAGGYGELDFVEFSVALWNFCTISYMPLGSATFLVDVADTDKSGNLDFKKMMYLMCLVHGATKKLDITILCTEGRRRTVGVSIRS